MRIICSLLCILLGATSIQAQKKQNNSEDKVPSLSGVSFRALGPALVSGRVIDLAVNPVNHDEFYVAAASGGVWKTSNHGNTFTPIFDNYGSYSIGCVTIDPNNPNTIWVGTGENNNQRSVAYGDGLYKSLDGGKSFEKVGLAQSEHISRILIHPNDGNTVYVAAYGPLWSAGGDRGVYKTTDGGKTWQQVLKISDNTGVADLWMDPTNPDVLYATAHQRRRHVWTYLSGGPESGIHKSTDGGATWREINKGLPQADLGRIALAISPADPMVLYAMVEGFDKKHGGFYRSTNMGESWERRSDYFTSGNYYIELIPDPVDVNKVYSMDTWLHHTEDGGKTFKKTGEKSKHVDNHAMWINPNNTNHWLVGCDGGLYETWDAAENWKFFPNLSLTQFYRVAIDNDLPFYNIYGGTQDNNTIGGPSRTTNAHGISNFDWYITRGGDGFEPQVDPENPNIIYSQAQYGWLVRYNKLTGERVNIKPVERKGEAAYRWNWDAPLIISPHNNKRLYFAANKVFKSDDRGNTWEVISEDLSQQIDRNKLKVMGRTWGPDAVALHKSTSIYGNVVSLTESPVQEGLLYAGTDDGLIHITEDNGATWKKYGSFLGIPPNTYVMDLRADLYEANTIYVVFNNHKNGDFKPYIMKSTNKGASWTNMSGNLPKRGSVYTLRQDHENPKMFFAGTEFGVFFTVDGGQQWTQIKGGLPTIAIRDMEIQTRENDLVLASFGRGFYVLDNYAPLRSIQDTASKEFHIFPVKDALMFNVTNPLGTKGKASQGEAFYTTPNPPVGATITYYLNEGLQTLSEARRKAENKVVKSGGSPTYPDIETLRKEDREQAPYVLIEILNEPGDVVARYRETKVSKGINQTVWDFRTETTTPVKLKDSDPGRYGTPDWGALASPGQYTAKFYRVQLGEVTELGASSPFKIKLLHDDQISKVDLAALTSFIDQVNELRKDVRGTNAQFGELKKRLDYMHMAVLQAPGASLDIIARVDDLMNELSDARMLMNGDPSKRKREMETYGGIMSRVEMIAYNLYNHTEAPTNFEIASLKTAREEYDQLKPIIATISSKIDALAEELEAAGSPYFPR